MNEINWSSGLNDFRKHNITIDGDNLKYTTEFTEYDFEPNRTLDAIFYDHLKNRESNKVELLYSGGMDSQFVLESCIRNKIPVEAMTMVIKVRGAIVNVTDLYYAEKFCRENNVKQNFFYLDALDFYESGKYLAYLEPYYIKQPHVASHFWLMEQCQSYPIIGGDWPWVHTYLENKILSPYKLSYSSYERFLKDKGMYGIGDFISHSFESAYRFIKLHIENKEYCNGTFHLTPFLKQKVYQVNEPRIKSYGWEDCPKELFDVTKYSPKSIKHIIVSNEIIWGDKISKLINSTVNRNNKF